MHASGSDITNLLVKTEVDTDQPGETVCLQRPMWLDGVSFWTVTGSLRHWTMHHDTFTASLVLGPRPTLRATWSSRGEERTVAPGSVQLMVPGESHRTISVSEPASFFVVWWSPEALERAAEQLAPGTGRLHFVRPQLEHPGVTAALTSLHRAVSAGASRLEIDQHYLDGTALLLEQATERSLLQPRLGKHHPSVRRALARLHDAFADNVSLDELSKEAQLSKFHLARCFREATGMAPHQYQKLLRLQAGRRQLEAGDSVRSAALRAGFADGAHFARAFREWLGVSPSRWASAHA